MPRHVKVIYFPENASSGYANTERILEGFLKSVRLVIFLFILMDSRNGDENEDEDKNKSWDYSTLIYLSLQADALPRSSIVP